MGFFLLFGGYWCLDHVVCFQLGWFSVSILVLRVCTSSFQGLGGCFLTGRDASGLPRWANWQQMERRRVSLRLFYGCLMGKAHSLPGVWTLRGFDSASHWLIGWWCCCDVKYELVSQLNRVVAVIVGVIAALI